MSGPGAPTFRTSDKHAMVLALAAGHRIAGRAFLPDGRVSLTFDAPEDFEMRVANGALPALDPRAVLSALVTVDGLIRSARRGGR